MDASPVRGQNKIGIAQLNHIKDPQIFQSEIVRAIRSDLQHAEVFFSIVDPSSKALQLPAWIGSHLERHPELTMKLEQGSMVGISHTEDHPRPRPASATRSSVVLIPVTSDAVLYGAIGLISPLDGPQLSAEDIEGVRQLAHAAAPTLARLQELDSLRRRNHQLETLHKMYWHLQSNVAHELRTPLAAIRGYARMILDGRGGQITDIQRDYLRVVTENTNRLINVVSWMSHVAELSAQQFSLNKFDLRDTWAESKKTNSEFLSGKSVTLSERIPDESFEIIADREKLNYVLTELLAAAVKVSDAGSTVTAEFSHGREREVTVKISASGSGMLPEELSKIFDRSINSSVKPMMKNTDNTGINLSGAHDVVGMHGGRMFVNSTPERGSTFLFTLPAVNVGGEDKSHEQAVNFSRR